MKYAWMFLAAAIATEVAATLTMSESAHSGEIHMYAFMCVLISSSYILLSFALRKIRVGVAVAIWEGAGAVLIAMISILFLGEPISIQKLVGIALSMGGIGLLHYGSSS